MPKPVCVPCQRFFRPHRNGTYVLEMMPKCNDAPKGTEDPNMWAPYKVWQTDLWKCESCGTEICVGFGRDPISEHYMDNFEQEAQRCTVQVNDC